MAMYGCSQLGNYSFDSVPRHPRCERVLSGCFLSLGFVVVLRENSPRGLPVISVWDEPHARMTGRYQLEIENLANSLLLGNQNGFKGLGPLPKLRLRQGQHAQHGQQNLPEPVNLGSSLPQSGNQAIRFPHDTQPDWGRNESTRKLRIETLWETLHRRVYSQGGQDGVFETIFASIGTCNSPPFAVEFGFDSNVLLGGTGANVANLCLNHGFKVLLLDGKFDNPQINLHKHFLTPENIVDLFKKYQVPEHPDLVSIDVDSTDLWLMRAVLAGGYKPRVLSVEYNQNYAVDEAITVPPTVWEWQGDALYGASLAALNMVAEEYGYKLVEIVEGLDAIFVPKDLVEVGPTSSSLLPRAAYIVNQMHARISPQDKRINQMMDYAEFVRTGNLTAAQSKATNSVIRRCVGARFDRTQYLGWRGIGI